MDMDWFHEHEKDLKEELESINPNNKALNICYSSTHEAIESYLSAILYEKTK